MKTLKLIIAAIVLFASTTAMQAQVSVNVNLGNPPAWGPVVSTTPSYYYLPDIESYYDVRTTEFVYLNNGRWSRSRSLPSQYRSYNLYNGYKVIMNDGPRPYNNFKSHKVKYFKGYKGKPQKTIGSYRSNNNKVFKSAGSKGNGNSSNGNKVGSSNNGGKQDKGGQGGKGGKGKN